MKREIITSAKGKSVILVFEENVLAEWQATALPVPLPPYTGPLGGVVGDAPLCPSTFGLARLLALAYGIWVVVTESQFSI